MTRLNEALINQFHFENLVTLFYGVLDTVSGRLEYASAGHEPPIIIRNADRKLDRIEPTGTVVGLDIGIEFGDAICQMAVNDVLVLLTDGFVEARSRWAAGILGEARLHEGLLKSIADSEDLQAGADSMWEYVVDAMGTGDLEDDAALLLVARCLERGSKGGLAYSTLRQPMKRPASYRATGGKSFRLAG